MGPSVRTWLVNETEFWLRAAYERRLVLAMLEYVMFFLFFGFWGSAL